MTDEEKRKGLADYFTPTLVEMKQSSAGSNGFFGGSSIIDEENYPHRAAQTGHGAIVVPQDSSGGPQEGSIDSQRRHFQQLRKMLEERMSKDVELRALKPNVSFIEMKDGLRIDLVDQANFSMFELSTDTLVPKARKLVSEVARVLTAVPNDIIVRGHTDSLPYASGKTSNNWMLSSMRAEATRQALAASGITGERFSRIEGVADREPFVPGDRYDPRNRRMSIIVAWSKELGPAPTPGSRSTFSSSSTSSSTSTSTPQKPSSSPPVRRGFRLAR
jgi:chemotaxis protein MotB